MIGSILVDAGPLVAVFSARDRHHAACVDVLGSLRGRMLTTWPPVVEAMYLLEFSARAQAGLLEMMERGVLEVLELGSTDLPQIRRLMSKYRDLPMDFADATLVHVAARDQVGTIFTLDRRDFSVYRLPSGQGLRIVPEG